MEAALTPEFWFAVGQIILIDIVLGGDNAVVIALACRQLPPNLRTKGIVWGTVGAILIRVVLIFFALTLLSVPYLKLVGAALLLWIGVKLLVAENEGHSDITGERQALGRGPHCRRRRSRDERRQRHRHRRRGGKRGRRAQDVSGDIRTAGRASRSSSGAASWSSS